MSDARSRFAVLLFTDIVSSTSLKAAHGVPAYSAALQRHNSLFEGIAGQFDGMRILRHTGDGYFALLGSIADAVRFALLFQHAMRMGPWDELVLTTRVGIHAGEVAGIESLGQPDVIAPAADLAARVMSLAQGGQILLTRTPFDEARHFLREHPTLPGGGAPALCWLAHGLYRMKGAEEPMEVFEVGAHGLAPLSPPPDGDKVQRAIRPGEKETLGWRPAVGLEVPGRPGWRLVDRLGAGGFGEVWVAEHTKLAERRAFKFCFDDDRLRALKREVTLTRLLREVLGDRHDIVRYFELKLDEPPFYLESEYAPEGNLLQWAERRGGLTAIPLATRIEIVAASAAALAGAHSVGVLHKDVKPSNILIFLEKDGSPQPRLIDFGIGMLADASMLARHGVSGMGFTDSLLTNIRGTPLYSPPEYLAGRPYTVQGDVFGLGLVLYQLVVADAQRPLAPGWERGVDDEHLRADIAACVDGDPARRLAGATELAKRLRALDSRRAESGRLAAAARLEESRRHRQRRLRLATAAALLVAAVCLPLALWALGERNRAREQVREASRSDFATAQGRLADGRWQEGVAYLGRALRYDPENRNASDALLLTLLYGRRDAGALPIESFVHDALVTSASFAPDGARIVTASADGTGRIWDTATGQPLGAPLAHERAVNRASFSPDGTRVVTASDDNAARVWDTATGQPLGAPLAHTGEVASANFSPDGTRVVTASADNTARLWDARTGQPLGAPLSHAGAIASADFSPDGTRVVTAGADNAARLWDAATDQPPGVLLAHESWVYSASFSPDGTRVVTASDDNTARLWDARTGQPLGAPLSHAGEVASASFSPDGARVVTASADKTARLWDARTGQPLGAPLVHAGWVNSASFSPDGTRVVTASFDKTARLWDAASGQPLGAPLAHAGWVYSASFSPDGTRVVTASDDKTARLWDAATGHPLGAPLAHAAKVASASFSPDGTRVVTASLDKTAQLWDASTGQPLGAPLAHKRAVNRASFSPDGTRVVTASADNTARLWDARTGQPLGAPLAHAGEVISASFSPDGTRVVTASTDHTARIWDSLTGQRLGAPLTHESWVYSASFSLDGTRVVTASLDRTVRLWDISTVQPLDGWMAEDVATICAGARLNPELGILTQVPPAERKALWWKLEPKLAAAPDWRVAAERTLPQLLRTRSPQSTVTRGEYAGR